MSSGAYDPNGSRSDVINDAIPMFFAGIALEVCADALTAAAHAAEQPARTSRYRLNDTISSLSAGVMSEWVVKVLGLGWLKIAPYAFVYEHARLWTLPAEHWLVTLAMILLVVSAQ